MQKKLSNVLIVLMLVFFTSGSSILFSWTYKIPLLILVAFLLFYRRNQISNVSLFLKVLIVILVWLSINFMSYVIMSIPFDFIAIVLFSTNLILALFVLSLLGWSFWFNFEKIVFYLTFVSLPIFLLNIIMPSYFESLISVFRPLTNDRFFRFEDMRNYWSAIVYVKAIKADFLYRNCGFMWEPGSFAMIIIWGTSFNWLVNGIRIDKKTIVYSIALLTTQSTAGYIAFFILLLAANVKKFMPLNILFIIAILFIFFKYVYNFSFVGDKLDTYFYAATNDILDYSTNFGAFKVNRIQILQYDIIRLLKYPFGYGYNYQGEIVSVNGLSSLLLMWGAFIFSYFIFLLWKFYKMINNFAISKNALVLLFFGILIMLFSNPIQQNIFFYLLIATPIVLNVNKQAYAKME